MMDFTPKKTSEIVFSNNTSRTSIHGILDGELPFSKNGISGLLFYGVYGSGKLPMQISSAMSLKL